MAGAADSESPQMQSAAALLIEGISWNGTRRHYLLSKQLAFRGGDFVSEQALCGTYVQGRSVFDRRYPNKQFDQAPLCAHCKRLGRNLQVAGRPTLDQAAAAVKPLFVQAGLVDLDAEDFAYDAARAIMRQYTDITE